MSKIVTPFVKQCFVTAAVGINIISHGAVIGFPAILLPQLKEPGSGFVLTKEEESWLASILAGSMLIGSFVTTPVSSRLGRRGAYIAVSIPIFVGLFMTVLATDVYVLILARAILGISYGLLNILRSVLIGEYTSPKNRGAFLTIISLAQAFGIFFIHLIGSLLSWQSCALICTFFVFISLLMMIYAPESPSWLASKGKYDECRKVFRWLRGDEEEEELEEMIEAQLEIEAEKIRNTQINHNHFKEALDTVRKKEFYKPILIMIHANMVMQFAGGTTMAAYSTVILSQIMGSTANVNFWMVFLDTQRIITNTIAIFVINRIKRRTMMFSVGGLCVLSHIFIAFYVYGNKEGWIPFMGVWLPALLVNIQFFTVGMAMVPMPNIIAGEVFPLEYRSIAGTISNVSLGITMFLVLKTFPTLIEWSGISGTYILYSVILTYFLSVMWVLLPETKGRTLQQIEDEFRGRPLKAHEIEARQSLHTSRLEMAKRKLSDRKCSSVSFE